MADSHGIRRILVGAFAVLLASCGGSEDVPEEATDTAETELPEAPPPDVQPVKSPQPPEPEPGATSREGLIEREPCDGSQTCVSLGSVSVGHGSPGIDVYFDPERDDEITRWSATLGGVINCVEAGQDLGGCVASSDASETCRSEFVRLSDAGGDRAAFEAVFLTPGSPCRPEEEVSP